MFSDESNRSGIRSSRLALKLRRRQESKDRQSNVREEVVEDISTASDESPGEEFWIDDHFQHTLKGLVRTFIEAENELYALQGCIKRLEQSKSEGKVPSGMKIHRINAKGRNRQPLQEMFDTILREAKLKLLNATIKTLQQEEQHCLNHCTSEKEKITSTIVTWRELFKASDASLDIDADHFVTSKKCFVDIVLFQYAAIRTSKQVAGDITKAAKEAMQAEQREWRLSFSQRDSPSTI